MSLFSNLGDRIRNEFKAKDGFLKRWHDPNDREMVRAKRIGTVSAVGGGAGMVAGALAGGILAQRAINAVPIQQKTVDYRTPNLESTELGRIPQDKYTSVYGWSYGMSMQYGRPGADGNPAVLPVNRDNPIYRADGTPDTVPATKTFSGHGTPVLTWQSHDIVHHTMNGYNRAIIPHTESVYDHTDHWTEQVPYTTYTTESEPYQDCSSSYNSDGSTSQDCHTSYRSVSVSHTEYRTESRSRDVYRDELRGWWERYSPNIQDRVAGHWDEPKVRFDHGINVAGYIGKGLLIGAAVGAVALGLTAAIEDKHFHLPGWKPLPGDPVEGTGHQGDGTDPKPPDGTDPVEPPKPPTPPTPPPEPKPDYGGYKEHSHAGKRHAHDGGDRWHFHGCPSDGALADPLNTDWICFKPDQVPSGYNLADGKQCPENGSICFPEKGRKS